MLPLPSCLMILTKKYQKIGRINRSGSTSVARVAQERRFHFTRERIEALPSPSNGQRAYYYDAKVRGLAVAISPAGKKVFVLYRKVAGRPERMTIGPFVDLSIEQARKKAEELNGHIAEGKNPAATMRQVRDEMTLGELFEMFIEQYAKQHKRTWADDVATFNFHLHRWHLHKISTIRKVDVVALHTRIGSTRGKYVANRVIELLCTMFNKARQNWGWAGENPAAGIKAFREHKRARFLQAEELPAFFKSLAAEPNHTIRDYVLVSLLCGARRANAQSMRWDEINFTRATWIIPADKAKEDEPIDVTLTPVVLRILRERKLSSKSEWVFPGCGRTGHLVEPKTAWKRILKRAGLVDLRLHDLRRSLGSWQAITGASLPIIGKSLGHKSSSSTEVYARLAMDPVRQAVNAAQNAMLVAGGVAGLLGEGK
jgi:integrase